jgi:hypothetical protein
MKEIIDKISSYNLFNHLFPGVLFVILTKELTHYSLIQSDIVIGVFLYYFIGLVICRFGSLIIEPIFLKIHFLKFGKYTDFISACRKDSKIETLTEVNNMYRTLTSMFVLLLLIKIYELVASRFQSFSVWIPYILIILCLVTFICSYKKQTDRISKRIEASNG